MGKYPTNLNNLPNKIKPTQLAIMDLGTCVIEAILCGDVAPDLDFLGHFCLTDRILEWETERGSSGLGGLLSPWQVKPNIAKLYQDEVILLEYNHNLKMKGFLCKWIWHTAVL